MPDAHPWQDFADTSKSSRLWACLPERSKLPCVLNVVPNDITGEGTLVSLNVTGGVQLTASEWANQEVRVAWRYSLCSTPSQMYSIGQLGYMPAVVETPNLHLNVCPSMTDQSVIGSFTLPSDGSFPMSLSTSMPIDLTPSSVLYLLKSFQVTLANPSASSSGLSSSNPNPSSTVSTGTSSTPSSNSQGVPNSSASSGNGSLVAVPMLTASFPSGATSATPSNTSGSNTGYASSAPSVNQSTVIGGAIGAACLILLAIVFGAIFYRRRRNHASIEEGAEAINKIPMGHGPSGRGLTPYYDPDAKPVPPELTGLTERTRGGITPYRDPDAKPVLPEVAQQVGRTGGITPYHDPYGKPVPPEPFERFRRMEKSRYMGPTQR